MQRTLYKYVPCNSDEHIVRLERILRGQIYFSSPANFNDPFEMSALLIPRTHSEFEALLSGAGVPLHMSSPSLRKTLYREYLGRAKNSTLALERAWVEALGVLCLTTSKDNILMWAHYADSHKGICIGFDSGAAPFSATRRVEYSDERAQIAPKTAGEDERLIQLALLTKSLHWSYEEELRVIKRPVSDDEKDYYRRLFEADPEEEERIAELLASEGGAGNYDFDPSAVRVIYLGAQVSPELKSKIVEMVRAISPFVRIEQMEMDRRRFELHARKLTRNV